MSQEKIVVIGGYGRVGTQICRLLAKEVPGAVVIAGPSINKAEELAQDIGSGTTAMDVDVFQRSSYEKIFEPKRNVRAVISCVELPVENKFAEDVIKMGINFTELSATYASQQKLFDLQSIALTHTSTAVVGVGLMPGLSNVMAADAVSRFDTATSVSINILLGLGEAHGADAVRWTLRNMGTTYDMRYGDIVKKVRTFTDPRQTTLLNETAPRRFYRFNFSDQHVLNKSLSPAHVDSRLGFDSKFITDLLGFTGKIGLLSLVRENAAPIFSKIIKMVSIGDDRYAVQVEANGERDGKSETRTLCASGQNEAIATATVATFVGKKLLANTLQPGIYPIEQAIDSEELYKYLSSRQVIIQNIRKNKQDLYS